jgi:hypothetical protein
LKNPDNGREEPVFLFYIAEKNNWYGADKKECPKE